MIDIVTGVDEMIKFGNLSAIFTPVVNENFLVDQNLKFLSDEPRNALRIGNFKKVSNFKFSIFLFNKNEIFIISRFQY